MNYISIDNISKAFSDKLLFENISFGIEKGEKTALVAANGTGKSTMMKILVGKEESDKGSIAYNENIRIGYLEQLPQFNPELTIQDVISTGHTDIMNVIQRYESALLNHVDDNNLTTKKELEDAISQMDSLQAWSYEQRLKQLLYTFPRKLFAKISRTALVMMLSPSITSFLPFLQLCKVSLICPFNLGSLTELKPFNLYVSFIIRFLLMYLI